MCGIRTETENGMSGKTFALPIACVSLLLFGLLLFGQDKNDKDQPGTLTVDIRDYCDPVSFAAIGCVRTATPVGNGLITLAGFGAELAAEKSVGAWRFIPDRASNEDGINLNLKNLGGETHTFTRVKEFGGGFVAALNAASGNPTPAPECAKVVNGNLVPQPPSADNIFLPGSSNAAGPHVAEGERARFQCCIHPWMRTVINTKDGDDRGGDHDSH
jgi:hypothetical protein